MNSEWRFAGLKTGRGNILTDFVSQDVHLETRTRTFLKRLKFLPHPWRLPHYRNLGDGLGELRLDYRKVEYRFYGFYGPGTNQFTVILASGDKKKQEKNIADARRLKKRLDLNKELIQVEDHHV